MENKTETSDCPICLETFNETILACKGQPCKHIVCMDCCKGLSSMLAKDDKVSCPMCRADWSDFIKELCPPALSQLSDSCRERLLYYIINHHRNFNETSLNSIDFSNPLPAIQSIPFANLRVSIRMSVGCMRFLQTFNSRE